jgi:Poly(ADP-ribose) polymerase catalytic domain
LGSSKKSKNTKEILYVAGRACESDLVEVNFPNGANDDITCKIGVTMENDEICDLSLDGCSYSENVHRVMQIKCETGLVHASFLQFCLSFSFTKFVSHWGIRTPVFVPNPFARKGASFYDNFDDACCKLGINSTLELVFHGTRATNISNILENGLDPSKRKGQSYGPGEYFGRQPNISISYCHGDKSMLVFVIVKPDDAVANKYRCPEDYVVVSSSEYQLPIGTLRFTSFDAVLLEKSMEMKRKLTQLSREVQQKQTLADAGMIRAAIIQAMIVGDIHVAGEKYETYRDSLSGQDHREISMYAHDKYDAEIIPFYFPNIPEPMTRLEHELVRNADTMVREARDAQKELNQKRRQLSHDLSR